MLDIILFGKPGAGKDTLSQHICNKYNYVEINMGKILREMAEAGDPHGVRLKEEYWAAGNLVPDHESSALAVKYVSGIQDKNKIYNGWPRTAVQVRNYFKDLKKEEDDLLALDVTISDKVAIERLLARGRVDDTEEIIQNRIKVYENQTKECSDIVVSEFGITVKRFNGGGTIENMCRRFDKRFGRLFNM